MNDTEQWKIFYYNNKPTNYKISSYGKVYNTKTNKMVEGTYKHNEYHTVQIILEDKPTTIPMHRLVAETFLPNPNNYKIVNHIDRNKINNHVDNLRWASAKTNANNVGERHHVKKNSYYQGSIDDFQEVRASNGKFLVNTSGLFINKKSKQIVYGSKRNGYRRILCDNHWHSAHRLVWETFVGPIHDGMVIDHINGIRDDNRLVNLQEVSQSENMSNAYRNGHEVKKEVYQYSLDGKFIKKYDRVCLAAKDYQVASPAISSAAKRKGTCAGYFWSFSKMSDKEIHEIIEKNKSRSTSKRLTRYNLDGSNPKYYYSIGEAAEDTGCSKSTICRGIKGKRSAKGYYWILDSQKDEITIDDLLGK